MSGVAVGVFSRRGLYTMYTVLACFRVAIFWKALKVLSGSRGMFALKTNRAWSSLLTSPHPRFELIIQ